MTHADLVIRRMRIADAAACARIMGHPDVVPGLLQLPHTSEDVWKTRLADLGDPNKPDLRLCAELDGEVVGTGGLHPVGPQLRRRHVGMLGISVAAERQGQGIGDALMAAMCDYADRWWGLLRIELTVFADNARAIGLYRKHGFVVEGRLRGYAMRDGSYDDVLTMARLHPRAPGIAPHGDAWPQA